MASGASQDMTSEAGRSGGQQWQVGSDPRDRQTRPRRGRGDRGAARSRFDEGSYGESSGQDRRNGRGSEGGYGAANGHSGLRGVPASDGHGASDGYSRPDGYGAPDDFGSPAAYSAPGSRTAAGLRERAIDRTGIRERLADRRADPGSGGDGPAGGGRRPRARGRWWRHWTWRKVAALAAGACLLLLAIVIAGVAYAYERTPVPTDASATALQQSSVVYFSNGKTVVGTFDAGTNRQLLTSAQISPRLKEAVIAAEDRHFYTEGGISLTGIARAAYEDAFGSGGLQGGSTITEQFAKNYYGSIGTSRTISTKLKEIIVAIKLSHKKSKDWILTQYLNTIFLGDNSYGVGAAAETYFGKPAGKLNIAQSAMLAAMVNQPGFFDPTPRTPGHGPLVARWHYVLGNMVKDGAITQQQASSQKFPKITRGGRNNSWTGYRGYIMQAVEDELINRYRYSAMQIFGDGLKIVTTFSRPLMKALYQSVAQNEQQMAAGGRALPRYAHVGAVLQQPKTGAILAMYAGPNYGLSPRRCKRVDCQYNMALQSRNQVGSSFKPYVLATAVSQGMNVQTSILNGYAPLWIPPDTTQADRMTLSSPTPPADPAGWYNLPDPSENYGSISVAKAAALSSNSAFADLAHRVGTQQVADMAQSFGVNTKLSGLDNEIGGVGMALGQASLTVGEQANTFAALAADGVSTTPHVISSITAPSGPVALKIVKNTVLQPGQAADVDYALSFDTQYGTATGAAMSDGRPIIGKTGTTNSAQSAFFIGSIPQYTLAVGIFTQNQSDHTTETLNGLGGLSQGGYGGTWPAMIWHTFAEREFAKLPIKQFPSPPFLGSNWVQVLPVPVPVPVQRHHHQPPPPPQPSPTPTPIPSCTPAFGQPCPQPTPSQTPSPGPSPTPTCTPGRCPTPPGGG
jgi:membrane peptidoglycan carboxypeptidase